MGQFPGSNVFPLLSVKINSGGDLLQLIKPKHAYVYYTAWMNRSLKKADYRPYEEVILLNLLQNSAISYLDVLTTVGDARKIFLSPWGFGIYGVLPSPFF